MIWLEDRQAENRVPPDVTICPGPDFFERASAFFHAEPDVQSIVVSSSPESICVCVDRTLSEDLLAQLQAILSNDRWDLRWGLCWGGSVLCLQDMSQINWLLLKYAQSRNIPVCPIGLYWEYIGVYKTQMDLRSYERIIVGADDISWIHRAYVAMNLAEAITAANGIPLIEAASQAGRYLTLFENLESNCLHYEQLFSILSNDEIGYFVGSYAKGLRKRTAAVYGNCHFSALVPYLLQAPAFFQQYLLVVVPPVFDMEQLGITSLSETMLNKLDLLIYQQINADNLYGNQWSTADILPRVSGECALVCVPNTVFMGYFPQEGRRTNTILKNQCNRVPMFCGDKFIDRTFEKCGSIKETIRIIKDEDYLEEADVIRNLNKSFRMLELQDAGCHIQMKDYVQAHYRERYLFTEPKHPANIFFHEMAQRILCYIGLDPYIENANHLDEQDTLSTINRLLYPTVIKHLKLKFQQEEYYCDRRLTTQKLSFEEYVEVYIRNTCRMD